MNRDIISHAIKLAHSRMKHPLPLRDHADQRFDDALHSVTVDLLKEGTKPESFRLATHRLTEMVKRGQLNEINNALEELIVFGLRSVQQKLGPSTIMDACDLLRLSSCANAYRWSIERLGTWENIEANEAAALGQLILEGHRRTKRDPLIGPAECVENVLRDHLVLEQNILKLDASINFGRVWLEDYIGRGRLTPDRSRAIKDLSRALEHTPEIPLIPGMGQHILRDVRFNSLPEEDVPAAISVMAHDPFDNDVLAYLVEQGRATKNRYDVECLAAIPHCLTRLATRLEAATTSDFFLGHLKGQGLSIDDSLEVMRRLEEMHPKDERFLF